MGKIKSFMSEVILKVIMLVLVLWVVSQGLVALGNVGEYREILGGPVKTVEKKLENKVVELGYQRLPEIKLTEMPDEKFLEAMPLVSISELPEVPRIAPPNKIASGGREFKPQANARPYFFSYMSYKAITKRSSPQWRLQHELAETCSVGLRRVDGMPTVAVGTAYLNKGVGDILQVTLDSGIDFYVVVGDVKANEHTDPTNTYTTSNGCMLEFIVDVPQMESKSRQMGDVSHSGFPGSITSIRNTGVNVWD